MRRQSLRGWLAGALLVGGAVLLGYRRLLDAAHGSALVSFTRNGNHYELLTPQRARRALRRAAARARARALARRPGR